MSMHSLSAPSNNDIDPSFDDTSSGGDTAEMLKASAVATKKHKRMDDDVIYGVLLIICSLSVCRLGTLFGR